MDKDEIISFLRQQNETLQQQNKELLIKLDQLQAQLNLLTHKLFGKKSERKNPPEDPNSQPPNPPRSPSGKGPNGEPKQKGRRKLPKDLPRERVVYDLTDAEKICSCGQTKKWMGEEITEKLEIIPAKLFVQEHVRCKYGCSCGKGVTIAKMPELPIDKGIPGAGLLADIIISKYQDSMPLYRQMQRFKRYGIEISDNTMCGWIADCAFMFEPIVAEKRKDLLNSLKIHSDDTPVPVMSKGKTRQGRLWVYATDGVNTPACTIYEYTRTRAQTGPVNFLKNYRGYLQADAYSGYDKLYKNGDIIEVGCMAHSRRKFHEVSIAAKGDSSVDPVLDMIGKLYDIEREAKEMTDERRRHYRRKHAKPILKRIKRYINKLELSLIPKTPIANAVQYMQNQWRALCRYVSHGCLHIDNNFGERAMRIVAIGRKNWMFAGSDEGGKRAAIMYSILETCKQHQINPFEYLNDVLARIPNTKQQDIRSLLPYNWRPALADKA